MRITLLSTKGGVGKTTVAANLAGFLADSGYRVLLVDADIQPTLSSYYAMRRTAPAGLFELLVNGDTEHVVSSTAIARLDIVVSNDPTGQLPNLLLHAPDGRTRLKHSLAHFDSAYDFVVLDTPGSLSALQDAAVLAGDLLIAPVPPEMLSAREFSRGTRSLLRRLEPMARLQLPVPPLVAVLNRIDRTRNAKDIAAALRAQFAEEPGESIRLLDTVIPNAVAYREAATLGVPVHRHECVRPTGRVNPSALETLCGFVSEVFPTLPLDASLREGT